jgi:cytochrome c1
MPSARRRWLGVLAVVIAVVAVAAAYAWWSSSATAARTAIARQITGGDPDRAPRWMIQNGCAGCHEIPGVPTATGRVGPSLAKIKEQEYLGGALPNNPDNMRRWISTPRDVDPHTAMPNTGITDQQARDIAAYLYALP